MPVRCIFVVLIEGVTAVRMRTLGNYQLNCIFEEIKHVIRVFDIPGMQHLKMEGTGSVNVLRDTFALEHPRDADILEAAQGGDNYVLFRRPFLRRDR